MQYYPNNTASHYFTKLPQDISLSGEYEVGLAEIQFSNSYSNVEKNDCYFQYVSPETEEDRNSAEYNGPVTKTVFIPGGLYESNEFFTHTLNNLAQKELGQQKNGKPKVKFFYNRASRKISAAIYEPSAIMFLSTTLQRILSFRSSRHVGPGRMTGDFQMDLNEDFKSIYVYSDLVSARPVGDTMAPLLRIVPTTDKKQETVHYIYEKPHYMPLSRFQINAVEMLLMNDKGKTIAFTHGNTIVTLHFRHKRPSNY